ncbi:T9SS sorting signal type C domain-containing protein [Flavobacterium phragmitis]|uniref:Por secretion system C-terminal sorting domain-containing protein n=1 Tax=Flavobacterium phragmitis TaxID=739143 RepID=A0A1I1PXG0_9FLAO|nr:T9SS sorting signal type C domain-containing protein [Flavobacterium phragmitis]SFD10570.1 hypothetical protein SAMN05216297_104234 [Flavobacterium phragmitis]
MKKLYSSYAPFFALQLFLLLYPMTAQYAAVPSERSFKNLKTLYFPSSSNKAQIERHRVWLNLTNEDGIFKQLLIGYITGATNGWDVNFDSLSMDAYLPADFYSINENKKLVIQGRALPLQQTDIITLGYRSSITGNLKISIDRADGDLTNMNIYILDKETGTIHNLRNGGYTFSTQKGRFDNRFEIRYQENKNLGLDEPGTITQELTVVSRNNIITINSRDALLKEVSVFDITGKLLHSSQKIDASNLEINNIQAEAQILLVKTILENGKTITKKVIF